jgi:hypothetical protein
MPWKPEEAIHHTHLADTPARQRQWSHVANGVLARTRDDKLAIEQANAVLKKHPSQKDPEPKSESRSAPRKSALGIGMKPHAPKKHWSGH